MDLFSIVMAYSGYKYATNKEPANNCGVNANTNHQAGLYWTFLIQKVWCVFAATASPHIPYYSMELEFKVN